MIYFTLRHLEGVKRTYVSVCWYLGDQSVIDNYRDKCDVDLCDNAFECVEVQADGDELSHIEKRFTNLPMVTGSRVVTWSGDHAKFILDNLLDKNLLQEYINIMTIRDLRLDEVVIEIKVLPESYSTLEEHFDESLVETIKKDMETNVWAFADVEVIASWQGFSASAYLGCVSTESEETFLQEEGVHMRLDALCDLNIKVKSAYEQMCKLVTKTV